MEIFDLEKGERTLLMEEVNSAAACLKKWATADKINFAALGNYVPQLHVHVVARKVGDAAWPNAPFGAAVAYSAPELSRVAGELMQILQS
jgi:diadenosine tetraphosphate (Ap4A) HIT family hydrolase